jgi:hypothetical protein
MSMPEASMHEYSCTVLRKHYIRLSKYTLAGTELKTEAQAMKMGPYGLFRLCVAPPNPRHIPASLLSRERVHASPCYLSMLFTMLAISLAISGGTALPTCAY